MVNIDDIKKRAKRGKTDACLQLLQYYAQGSNGVSKDTFEAKKWGQRAISSWCVKDRQQVDLQDYQNTLKQASNGDPDACLLMASYCGTGTNNVNKNGSKANAWIEKAVSLFANGYHSQSSSTNNDYDSMSIEELTNLANNGDVKACLILADIYTKGSSQVFADRILAQHWLDIAESIQPGVTEERVNNNSNEENINTPYSGSAEEDEEYSDEYESDKEFDDDSDDSDDDLGNFDKESFLNYWQKNQIKFKP